jgi:hypothetical protein
MKRLRILLLVCIIMFGGLFSSSEAQISKTVGTGADCTGCTVYPLTLSVLCEPPDTCVRLMAPDWSNENRFYGTDSTNCRVSNDKGDTWSNCGSNPSATIYLSYAVTSTGVVLAAGNDGGGTVFRIRRSTDGGNTWSTVYDSAPINILSISAQNVGVMRCSQDEDLCTVIGRDGVNNPYYLISEDDGLTWTFNAIPGTNISNT